MPIVRLTCAKHPAAEQRTTLIKRLTAVIEEELAVPLDSINVIIEPIDPADWGVGGNSLEDVLRAHQ